MTQTEAIIDYIKENGSITQLEATQKLGILRLAARIADLKSEGYKFRTETEYGKNTYGKGMHYARYFIDME